MLLLINNCISHKIYLFWKLAIDVKIILFKLFVYFTYLLQSLNVNVFRLFKQYYNNKIDRFVYVNNVDFNKLDFLDIFQDFCACVFIKKTIAYTWKHTKIVSYNSNIVLESIKQKNVEVLARISRLATLETSIALNIENNIL